MKKIVDGRIWIEVSNFALIGVTKDFLEEIGDVTYVGFQKSVGDTVSRGDVIVSLETVKAAEEVVSPVSRKIIEVNRDLENDPEKLNEDPERVWFVKMEVVREELENL